MNIWIRHNVINNIWMCCRRESGRERDRFVKWATIYSIWCVNVHDHTTHTKKNTDTMPITAQTKRVKVQRQRQQKTTSNVRRDERWLADISIIIVCLNVCHALLCCNRSGFSSFFSFCFGIVISMRLNYLCDALRTFRRQQSNEKNWEHLWIFLLLLLPTHAHTTQVALFDTSNFVDTFKFKWYIFYFVDWAHVIGPFVELTNEIHYFF